MWLVGSSFMFLLIILDSYLISTNGVSCKVFMTRFLVDDQPDEQPIRERTSQLLDKSNLVF